MTWLLIVGLCVLLIPVIWLVVSLVRMLMWKWPG